MRLGRRTVGQATVEDPRQQRTDLSSSDGRDVVDVYVCLNLIDLDVVDESGRSVVAPNRKVRVPQTVSFDYLKSSPTRLAVADVENWRGTDFCAMISQALIVVTALASVIVIGMVPGADGFGSTG